MSTIPGSDDAEEKPDFNVDSRDVGNIMACALEPSYISEIARKLRASGIVNHTESFEDQKVKWDDISFLRSVVLVSKAVSVLSNNDRIEVEDAPAGQLQGSPKNQIATPSEISGDEEEEVEEEPTGKEWHPYTVVYNPEDTTENDINELLKDYIDTSVELEEKIALIEDISSVGNDVSKVAEDILQDCLERQFREYDVTRVSSYNDPGLDFYVEDEGKREWGLAVEISVRYVNPIDAPYINSKKDKAFDTDADLVILAPKFTDNMERKYEDPDDRNWHVDPEEELVHLHRLPSEVPETYGPFRNEFKDEDGIDEGNPIIVPDGERLRALMKKGGHVGDDYPIVEDERLNFRASLDDLLRDYTVITESRFRTQIRESIEPLLWEFLRPYKVEQFLIDMYWDKGLKQDDIGSLVDRTGGTIGTWMRSQKWDIITRGSGAPELSERVKEIWKRMYLGEEPFDEVKPEGQKGMSGYRIQAEYNRAPLYQLDDWREWFKDMSEEERNEYASKQNYWLDDIDYTVIVGAPDRLTPSYTFIMDTLRDMGVDIREPDEAPRVPYNAYPSDGALEYMINKDHETIVEVEEE